MCLLADRVDELRVRAGTERAASLGGYLDALAASPNPESTLRWMQTTSYTLVEDVVDGRLEISHQGFDQRQGDDGEGSALAYLRAALVAHGSLPRRDETVAAFDRWLTRELQTLPEGPDRATLIAFSTWQVARKLAAATARHHGAPPPSATKHARAQVRQAITLTLWLHAQHLELADLRQDLLDDWLTAGTTTRRAVNPFIRWLARSQPSRRLAIAWPVAAHNPPIASDAQRLHALASVLADRLVDPTVRFAAAAVLLFGQPLTRVAALHRDDLIPTEQGWQLRFGRRPVQSPAMLGDLLAELTSTTTSARTAASQTDWLIPGRKHGAHVTAEELRRQLRFLDLPVRSGRRGALLALASELPAAVLAPVGNSISPGTAEILMFPAADVPTELQRQVLGLHREAWPEHHSHGHDPALHPLAMLLLEANRVVSALDILSKDIRHGGDVYAASGLSAVVTASTQRDHGYGRHLVRAARDEIGRRGADIGLFTCDPQLQAFYEQAGWRTLSGSVLIGGTPDDPLYSDREDKITMGEFYSPHARGHAQAFIGTQIELYPGEIDKLW